MLEYKMMPMTTRSYTARIVTYFYTTPLFYWIRRFVSITRGYR